MKVSTKNQVLKEKLGKRRILLNDDQRRRLSVKGMSSVAAPIMPWLKDRRPPSIDPIR